MMQVFFDTNVIIDVVVKREPHFAASSALLSYAEKGVIEGLVSAISFNNLHYIIERVSDRKKARQAVSFLRNICKIVPLDGRIIGEAADSDIADFEDAIQFFSAIHCDADYLVTRNVKDFPQEDFPVLEPEEFLALDLDFN